MSKRVATAAAAKTVTYFTHKAEPVASLLSVISIESKFCSFDRRSVSTRYMIQWLHSVEAMASNPEAKLSSSVSSLQILFDDDTYVARCK